MIDTGVRLYDVVWVLAIALNRTMMAVESGDINGTGCEGVPGSLVPLEEFSYANEMMGCLIQWNLQRTNFSGVSVSCSNLLITDSPSFNFRREFCLMKMVLGQII